MKKLFLLCSLLSASLLLSSCEDLMDNLQSDDEEEEEEICGTSYADSGSALNLDGTCNLIDRIWGPGSNSIHIGGGLNLGTQPGTGWAQQYEGLFVTSYSLMGEAQEAEYITTSAPISVSVESQVTATIEVWDLETLKVVSSNIDQPGSPVVFQAVANHRYGGFAWYPDNTQKDLPIIASFIE